MNRMQKLGIDANTVEGLTKIMDINCINIDDGYGTKGKCKYPKNEIDICMKCKAERLLEEVPTKKVQRGTTYTDFIKAYIDWQNYANDSMAYKGTYIKYCDWLAEEIEVEDD